MRPGAAWRRCASQLLANHVIEDYRFDLERDGTRRSAMKFGVVVFPGTWSRPRLRLGDRPGARRRAPVPLAQGRATSEALDVRRSSRRVRLRRLPAHGRDRALLARHGERSPSSPSAAAWSGESATASRSCARRGSCPARWSATRRCEYRCQWVEPAWSSGRTCRSPPPARSARSLRMPISHGEGNYFAGPGHALAARAARPGRVPLLRRRAAGSPPLPTPTAPCTASRGS